MLLCRLTIGKANYLRKSQKQTAKSIYSFACKSQLVLLADFSKEFAACKARLSDLRVHFKAHAPSAVHNFSENCTPAVLNFSETAPKKLTPCMG